MAVLERERDDSSGKNHGVVAKQDLRVQFSSMSLHVCCLQHDPSVCYPKPLALHAQVEFSLLRAGGVLSTIGVFVSSQEAGFDAGLHRPYSRRDRSRIVFAPGMLFAAVRASGRRLKVVQRFEAVQVDFNPGGHVLAGIRAFDNDNGHTSRHLLRCSPWCGKWAYRRF